jgi:deoxyribonuclease-4
MNLGAHMSIAGGLPRALERGKAVGCSVVQIFLKNQVRWRGKPLLPDEIREFKRLRQETGIHTVFAHATYLINLASPAEAEWQRAVDAFGDELERAEALGLPFVVIHPGSHKGSGPEAGIARVTTALDELCRRTRGYRVKILLENTAGAGNSVGARFEELRAILERGKAPDRIGICLDTCHLFAAGYDIRTPEGYEATMAECERAVGARRVLAFHLNDAKKGLGSGLDRHQHIGEGEIGLTAFRCLLGDPRFAHLPMALETPKEPEPEADLRNLATLRRLKG